MPLWGFPLKEVAFTLPGGFSNKPHRGGVSKTLRLLAGWLRNGIYVESLSLPPETGGKIGAFENATHSLVPGSKESPGDHAGITVRIVEGVAAHFD